MLFAFNAILLIEFRPSYLPTYLPMQSNLDARAAKFRACNCFKSTLQYFDAVRQQKRDVSH